MFCPKCSQLQPSDEMRFCSRCGFALSGVAMLVENDGVIPQLTGKAGQKLSSSRKKVMVESAIFSAIAWTILFFALLASDFGGPLEVLAKGAVLLFFLLGLIGLFRFLYGFLFVKDMVGQTAHDAFPTRSQGALGETSRRAALPGQREMPAGDYQRRGQTNELLPQPSVTEHTTKLLDDLPSDRRD